MRKLFLLVLVAVFNGTSLSMHREINELLIKLTREDLGSTDYSSGMQQHICEFVDYIKNHQSEEYNTAIVQTLVHFFTNKPNDVMVESIETLHCYTSQEDAVVKSRLANLIAQAVAHVLPRVHHLVIECIFEDKSLPQHIERSTLLAETATMQLCLLSAKTIVALVKSSDGAARILANALIRQHAEVNQRCPSLIYAVAANSAVAHDLLKPLLAREPSILDNYALDHAHHGQICSVCNGYCNFKIDCASEQLFALINGKRPICEFIGDSPIDELLSLPAMQQVFIVTDGDVCHAFMTKDGERRAKLIRILKTSYLPGFIKEYIYGVLMNYPQEDIQFYLMRGARNEGYPNERGIYYYQVAAQEGAAWLKLAEQELDQIPDRQQDQDV